ncbi:gustatory receptor 68 [Bombyx mori]|uniref:Gustatory receptor n=1 Tax=Bombyx mori TaxID=7091 RepID=F8WPI3_BOMMO|nr:gustatory receptor 68 [Bombyx mori]BAK52800.1 gustatory receptor 68 [Bombyx mori]
MRFGLKAGAAVVTILRPYNLCLKNIFKPFYVMLSLLGLFPYSIRFLGGKQFLIKPKSIYTNAVCALSLMLSMTLFLIFHIDHIIYKSTEDNSLTEGFMTQVNYIIEMLNLEIFCVVYYFSSFLNRNKFVKVLNTVAVWSDRISISGIKTLSFLRLKIHFSIGILMFLLISQVCVNFTRVDSLWKKVLVMFTFNIPQMIQFTAILFYYILVNMVITLLVIIQENISISTRDTKTSSFIRVEHRMPLSLKQLELIYIKAFELKRDINKAFEAPILLTTMQCFHSIVSESHIIYHGAVMEPHMVLHSIMNCSVWILYQLFKLYILASTGHLLQEKIQHFSNLIHFHGKGLTVYGLFPLDGTLMFKVVASAAMYLIILVQFDKRN